MTGKLHFFDNASTTACLPEAADLVRRFSVESYGHPSSTHSLGQSAARAISDARRFFAEIFRVAPDQVIFTSGGTESDNLAIYGTGLPALINAAGQQDKIAHLSVLASATEHPAVKKTILSLRDFGMDARLINVDSQGQLDNSHFDGLLTSSTLLLSVHQVNNITGALLPVTDLASTLKRKAPNAVFHTDAVQSFGKVRVPAAQSGVDLVSISSHKVCGPKGVGALLVLNDKLLSSKRFRPLLWGGEQEAGWRSGTQNAGLIAGFHFAAERALSEMKRFYDHAMKLRTLLHSEMNARGMLKSESNPKGLTWNSPDSAIPHIVNISAIGYSAGPLARLLEERGFLVATGSACSSKKPEPDPTLSAMRMPQAVSESALRISFSQSNGETDVLALLEALKDSLDMMRRLGGGNR